MSVWQGIILGMVKAAGEIMPVDSLGHLMVIGNQTGLYMPNLIFGNVLRLGYLCAIFAYFWKEFWGLVKNPFQKESGILLMGLIPIAVAAYVSYADLMQIFSRDLFLAAAFVFTALLLFLSDNITHADKTEKNIGSYDALIMGCMLAAALPVGISKAAAVITAALVCGINRELAAQFAYKLIFFTTVSAIVINTFNFTQFPTDIYTEDIPAYMAGFVAAAVSGYLSLHILMRLLITRRLRYFSYYLTALAVWLVYGFLFT